MRAMMVWGLSLCLATAWVRGISLFGVWDLVPVVFAGLEGGGLKCTRGGARGDRPLSGRRCRFAVSYLLCLLLSAWLRPVRHSWCTVYILNTSSTSLIISHACLRWTWLFGACWTALHVVGVSLFCEAGSAVSGLVTRQLWWPWVACLAAAWEAFRFVHCILDGATRGRCLIILWGRGALCQRAGFWYTAVVVAVGCMPGCGLGGIWMCTLYYYWLCVFNVLTLVLTGSGTGSVFWISRAGDSRGVVHVAWSLGSWEAGVASECRLCWCLHTGTWCTWGIDQLSCVYFSLYWDLYSRCIGPRMTSWIWPEIVILYL